MLLLNIFIQISIIAALIILFLVLYILNHHMKASKGVELNEKCNTCASETCMIKLKDVNTIKEELKEELEKCNRNEEENNEER